MQYYSISDFIKCVKKLRADKKIDGHLPREWFDNFVNSFSKQFTLNTTIDDILFNGKDVMINKNVSKIMSCSDVEWIFYGIGGKSKYTTAKFKLFIDEKYHNCFKKEGLVPIKYVGGGMEGNVYEVCLKGNCNLVMKIVRLYMFYNEDIEKDIEKGVEKIKREIEYQTIMANKNLAPKIIDQWMCRLNTSKTDNLYVIVMEKMDGDLYSLHPFTKENIDIIISQVFEIIISMIENGICHNDTKLDNFLFVNKNNPKIYISDFGISEKCNENESKRTLFQDHINIFYRTYFSPQSNISIKVDQENSKLFDLTFEKYKEIFQEHFLY